MTHAHAHTHPTHPILSHRSRYNAPHLLPAMGEYMPINAEMTQSKNLTTGVVSEKPWVGGFILDNFIDALTKDYLPPLEFFSVCMAYITAKEFDININHGFDLKLAALEWKNWCASLPATACPVTACHPICPHSINTITQGPQPQNAQEGPHRRSGEGLLRREES